MNIFILYAHPEPAKSFNRALLDAGVDTLTQQGHEVIVSDLYSMGFNPIASSADFLARRFPERLHYDREQKYAAGQDGLVSDITREIEKILWCDIFIVQFPLYWFSMPAIMKGWFDRVFVNSVIYGAGKRYEDGGLVGKKAMVCMTTGAFEPMLKPDGLLGDVDVMLWPIHGGIFMYTGMQVLPPFVACAPAYQGQTACDEYIAKYRQHLEDLDSLTGLPTIKLSDFDENYQLKSGVTLETVAHTRKKQDQN